MIELENVSYTYLPSTSFECKALNGISLKINDGEFVGIVGRTGCGKSTLLRLITALDTPTQGRILLDGCDTADKNYKKSCLGKTVGIVFQYPEHQLFEKTIERDVAFGLKHRGLDKNQRHALVKWAIESVGFDYESVSELSPFSLSGGEKRRLAIAGVLACKPEILMLDEPFSCLDAVGREELAGILNHLQGEGVTIIAVSHNTDMLCELADRIIVMDEGRVIGDGKAGDIFCDNSLLEKSCLSADKVVQICHLLRNRGTDIPNIIRYDELLAHLAEGGLCK